MNGGPHVTVPYQLIVLYCNKSSNFLSDLWLFFCPEVGTFVPLKCEAVVF
jgi:hypothetical protein